MLKNLHAEIARSGATVEQLSGELGVTTRTLKNKLNGVTEFQRDEMYKLRDIFFPTLGIEYLFFVEAEPPSLENTTIEFEDIPPK